MSPRLLLVTFFVLGLAAVACGGGEDDPEPTPTPDTFDSNKLTGMVLAPEDVPDDLRGVSGTFSQGENRDVSFMTTYGDTTLLLQSTVGRLPDTASRAQLIERLRRALASVIGNERNYNVEGADLGFQYRYTEGTPSAVGLVIKGEFFVMVQLTSRDGSRPDEVYDEDALLGYVTTSLGRVQQFLADPDSITPVPGAVQYASPTPGFPSTATPPPP